MEGTQSFCVVAADGRASRKPIALGLGDGAWTEVVSGLKGDELVVKANAANLLEGQAVESIHQ